MSIQNKYQCYRCQAFGHTSGNCYKKPRCVKCAQSHLMSECVISPDTPAKCCNCSGDHPASYTQCPAYIKFLEKRVQVTSRDNMNLSNVINAENTNLQARNSIIKNVVQNSENLKVSSDKRLNPLVNAKRNTNTLEKRQTHSPKSYAVTINNNNMTMNDDISDLQINI